jgi:beta-galactosidase GanA
MINGTRLFVFSGEFHPFRLPVPSLWLDIFQKIKAIGFNAVSFYADWALLEGKQGNFSAAGVFAFEPFFDAAKAAGIYLIAVSANTKRHPATASWCGTDQIIMCVETRT